MTKPKSLYSPRTVSRFCLCHLLGLLGTVLLISPGCALFKIPAVEAPAVPLVLLQGHKAPEFSDDMSYDALSVSIEQSLAYLRALAPDTRFAFGADTYSVAHLATSLERFAAFLETGPDVRRSNAQPRRTSSSSVVSTMPSSPSAIGAAAR